MTHCPECRRELTVDGAAFCPYCGAQLNEKPVPEEIRTLFSEVEKQKDPVRKHAMLTQAQQQYPDSLEIAQEVLFLGRLHERSSKRLDYSVIKCYLWHMYLTPEAFTDGQKDVMRRELTGHPQLMRCLQLAPDADAFMRRYLRRLASEFVALFLMGSTYYTRSVFGFRLDNRMGRVLAPHAADMLERIRADEQVSGEHRAMMYDELYRAFVTETGGESRWLDELLEKKGHPVPRKG